MLGFMITFGLVVEIPLGAGIWNLFRIKLDGYSLSRNIKSHIYCIVYIIPCMIGIIKGFIYLEKAMITGILRVGKESIFSGLNNLKVYTLLSEEFSKLFGFTENEINKILNDFNCTN